MIKVFENNCEHCDDQDGGSCYPYYGLAPHKHDLSKTGSFIGSTVFIDAPLPHNFVPDHSDGIMEDTHGTWYCPTKGCKQSREMQDA